MLVIAGILVVGSFAMFGANIFLAGAETVATVNGEKVPASRYFRTLNQALQNHREKEDKDPDEAALRKMKDDIVRDFIQETLFLQEARKLGIDVSKQELAGTIQSYNIFHREGRFDQNQYFHILRNVIKETPSEFENETRVRIINNKLRNFIVAPVKVTEKEVIDEYLRANKGDMKEFAKKKEEFTNSYLNEKRYHLLNTWFMQIGEKAKIDVNLDKVEKSIGG